MILRFVFFVFIERLGVSSASSSEEEEESGGTDSEGATGGGGRWSQNRKPPGLKFKYVAIVGKHGGVWRFTCFNGRRTF